MPTSSVPARPERPSLLRHALVLGSLTALGAFGIDTYLPAFPTMARALNTGEDQIQLTLVSYFIALAVGQLFYGPISDMVGRKGPLYVGLALFILGSIGCALSPNVEILIALRFVQGLGACAGFVLALAAVRDLHSGIEAARLLSLMVLVLGVSPIVAPVLGSLMIAAFPWHSVFWFQAGAGLVCVAAVVFFLEETHAEHNRLDAGIGQALRSYGELLRDLHFVGIVLIIALTQVSLFAYLAGSPFLFLTLHGVTPTTYSLLFGLNGIGLIFFAQANAWLIERVGEYRLLRWSTLLHAAPATLLLVVALIGRDSLGVTIALLFLCVATTGVVSPTGSVIALEPYGHAAGAASALIGAARSVAGAAAGGLLTLFFDGTARPVGGVMAASALGALALSLVVARGREGSHTIDVDAAELEAASQP